MTPRELLLCSILLLAGIHSQAQQYSCIPGTTFGPDAGDYIARVFLSGPGGPSLDNTTTFTAGQSYQNYRNAGPGKTTRLVPGASHTLTIKAGPIVGNYFAAWIDFNADRQLNAGELVAFQSNSTAGQEMNFTVTPPLNAVPGYVKLRVRCAFNMTTAALCANFLYGETEDYAVLIDNGAPCIPLSGHGTFYGDSISAIALDGNTIVLPSGGETYRNWTSFGGTALFTNTHTITVTSGAFDENRIGVWADWDNGEDGGDDVGEYLGGGVTSTPFETISIPFTVPIGYAEPRIVRLRVRIYYGDLATTCSDNDYGQTIDLGLALRHANTPCLGPALGNYGQDGMGSVTLGGTQYSTAGPTDWTNYQMSLVSGYALLRGSTQPLTVITPSASTVYAWCDMNDDQDFDDIGESMAYVINTLDGATASIPFIIPASCPVGQHFVRVISRNVFSATDPNGCPQFLGSIHGEVLDFRITVEDPAGPCIPQNNNWTLYGDFIDGVVLNTLSNTGSGALFGPEYSDHTSMSTMLPIGSAQTVLVTSGLYATDHLAVWIDWNGDGDWNDTGEALGEQLAGGSFSTRSFPFTVPVVSVGSKRMRVRAYFGAGVGPCTSSAYGETED